MLRKDHFLLQSAAIAFAVGTMILTTVEARAVSIFDSAPECVKRFGMTEKNNILAPEHLWVNSGGLTSNPHRDDVAGVDDVVAPPWTTSSHQLRVTFNGNSIKPDHYLWLPGEFQRSAKIDSGVEIRTLLSPVFSQRGLVEWIELTNTSTTTQKISLAISSGGNFGKLPDAKWNFGQSTLQKKIPPLHFESVRPGWAQSIAQDGAFVIACTLPSVQSAGGTFSGELEIPAGQASSFAIILAEGSKEQAFAVAQKAMDHPEDVIGADRKQWANAINDLYTRLPQVTSSNHAVVDFYDRSLLSYPIARWDAPEFVTHPWYASLGIDGGGLDAYLWDYAYCSRITTLACPACNQNMIRLYLQADLAKGYALLPFSGKITGAHYSYNDYSIVRMIYNYVLLTGDKAFLNEPIKGKTVWEWAYEHASYLDDLSKPVNLIDYGGNKNLLEMRRTENYTHYVPSPNTERCWSYRVVDEMAGWAGKPSPGLSSRAADLAKVISNKLWSPTDHWIYSLDVKGAPHLGYSIQVFDTLRFDVLNQEERDGIVSHLNEREFLSPWGVHSYSKATAEYDSSGKRVDWGGPGVFSGDAPELVGDLLHTGYFAQADDVLSRVLWWGQSFPYYPQAIRADSRDYRRDGRANLLVGITAAENMIFGLLDLQVNIDGAVTINPHLPAFAKDLKFSGVQIRGYRFDVGMDSNGYSVRQAGRNMVTAPYGKTTVIPAITQH